jgi:diacylglycerol O-acyltransferase/trehalose O-mycolyltransferase
VRATVLAVALCLTVASPAVAQGPGDLHVVASQKLDSRLTELTMQTPAFADPVKVRVLLPADYSSDPRRRYPVLYLLHGSIDDVASWTAKGDAEKITAGLPLIVVMPAQTGRGNGGGWASDWLNGGAGGPPKWETFHIRQLIPWVDSTYRTVPQRGGRALAGLSMGGFNAMSYAARHPDLFVEAASFSGAVDTNYSPVVPIVQGEALADGGGPDSIWGDRATDEVVWRAHNPWDLAQNLTGLKLSVRTGNGSRGPYDDPGPPDPIETGVHDMSVSFHGRLNDLRLPHVWDDYGPGTHSWPYWQRDLRAELPLIMATFAHPPSAPDPFTYTSAEPSYDVFGWHVSLKRDAMEFSTLAGAGARGFTLRGSGAAAVTTGPLYKRGSVHTVTISTDRSKSEQSSRANGSGRLHLEIPLGPSNSGQQYRPGTVETKVFSTRVSVSPDPAEAGCLARRAAIGPRGIGRVRLGLTRKTLLRRAPAPRNRLSRSWRWCVNRSRGSVRAVFSSRGTVQLVASTATGHGNRGVRPGARLARLRRAYPLRRGLGRGLFRAGPRSRRVIGVRRGRVRYVAVASGRLLGRRAALRASLRRAGLL